MKVQDISRIRDSAVLVELLPYLEVESDAAVKAIVNRAVGEITAGTLTPELAMSMWYEVKAHKELLSRLQSRVKVGVTLGKQHKNELDKGAPNAAY